MKLFSLILMALCLSISASAQQSSGPVINAATISIEADDDADNDGKFVVKTRHVERFAINNDGKVSIGAGGGSAIINVNTLPSVGAVDVLSMPVQDGATVAGAKFGIRYNSYVQQFGSDPRHDNTIFFGYNPDNQVATEVMAGWRIENRYETSTGRKQSEVYLETSVPGLLYSRAIALDLYHDNGETQLSWNTPRLLITEGVQQQNAWLEFLSSATTGNLNFRNDSGINYGGTRKYYVSHHGVGVLGRDLTNSRVWNFVFGGAQMETAHFFENDTLSSGPLTLSFGQEQASFQVGNSARGLKRWQGTGEFSGFSDVLFDADTSAGQEPNTIARRGTAGELRANGYFVRNVRVVGVQCGTINDVIEGDATDIARAISQILTCLREHGLVATN